MNWKYGFFLLLFIVLLGFGLFYQQMNKSSLTLNEQIKPGNTQESVSINKSNILNLSNQGLEKLPASVLKMTNLEELNISSNQLTGALPAEIHDLKNLKVLNASNNLMTGVPAEVGQLSNLEVLDLSSNRLTGLPNELGNLKKLKKLNLSGNDYSRQDLEVIKKGLPSSVEIIL